MLKISNRSSWIAMREEENVSEATYKEIMSEHFLELMKDSNPKTQKIQQNQNRFIKRLPDQIHPRDTTEHQRQGDLKNSQNEKTDYLQRKK